MSSKSNSKLEIDNAAVKYGLSLRAADNSLQSLPWDQLEKLFSNLWSIDNPDGLVYLGVAENFLLQKEVAQYITNNMSINASDHLGYGAGPRGSPALKKALARLFNAHFRAHEVVVKEEILVLPGVISVIDSLTWAVCNEEDGIIVPLPYYTGFRPAVKERSRGVLIPAEFQGLDGYRGLDDIFEPETNRKALERALAKSVQNGIKARAVLLSNPHNPIGRCYPAETLREIALFCGRHSLHLISDEIFAQSVYETTASDATPFTSVLAIDLKGCIDRHLVHVAYGIGKDYGSSGLRLAALHSRNQGLLTAISSICVFGWAPYVTQDVWAKMLEDEDFSTFFRSKNRRLLGEHYSIITRFLDERGIPYYQKSNAGCFIWVDLRTYICGTHKNQGVPNLSPRTLSLSELKKYQDREDRISKRLMVSGVGISSGTAFSTEELGWFRVSFAVEKDALHVGLERLLKCLNEIKADGWET